MNPPDEAPQSSVNGQTRTIEQGSARPNKPKPRKGDKISFYILWCSLLQCFTENTFTAFQRSLPDLLYMG